MYQLILYLHILGGIVWVGGAVTIQVLAVRFSRADDPGDTGSSVVCVANHLYGDAASCQLGDFTNDDGKGYYRVMKHSCDASGGQSGSALYHYVKGAPVVAGIHTFSTCGTTAMGTQCTSSDDRPLGGP